MPVILTRWNCQGELSSHTQAVPPMSKERIGVHRQRDQRRRDLVRARDDSPSVQSPRPMSALCLI